MQRIRHTAIPWPNSNIKKMMRNRDYHKKQSVKYGSEYHWRLYHGPPGTESILKFGKVNLVITAKNLANVI
jgi:hypothetical protein